MKIASKMIQTAIQKISDMGGEIINGYTAKTHATSINLHKSLGFIEKPCVQFDNLIFGEEQIMLELKIEHEYNAIPATSEEAVFVSTFYRQNREALHGKHISFAEWKEILSKDDPDEQNFLVCKGAMPVAWFRVNGLEDKKDMAWLSMIAVSNKYQKQGIGSFAVRFAEDFVQEKGFKTLGIRTTADNVAAQILYRKLGYHVHEDGECTNGDGEKRSGLGFHRDKLNAVRMNIDGVQFYVGQAHDFSFINKIGKVFRVFDAMDSGNICFGVENNGKHFFVKYAGARTQNYNGELSDAINRLKNAMKIYEDLQHPYLIRLIQHYPVENGYLAVFDWVDGEGLRSYWNYVGKPMWSYPDSPNYRFRHLPIEKRIAVVDKIMAFHHHIIERGYIPVDFYDGSMLYNFDTDEFYICDIDFYRKSPAKNDMGIMWGSKRFMSPEEFELGADLNETTVVYLMGAAAFELLGNNTDEAYQAWENGKLSRSFTAWNASKALFDVAMKAASTESNERYKTLAELVETWNTVKTANTIQYRQLNIEDITPDLLKHFNRCQETKKIWKRHGTEYVLENEFFINDWDDNKKPHISKGLAYAINSGGFLFAAYDDVKLIGFAAVFGNLIGSKKEYLQLDMMHVSYEYRGKGIGGELFVLCVDKARQSGAGKLYISAHPSEETQAFYRSMGFADTEEIIPELFNAEPYDVHLEYNLKKD